MFLSLQIPDRARAHRRSGPAKLRSLRVVAALLLAFMVVPLVPTRAFAHGDLQSATPGDGDQLSVAPRELRLTFTEAVELAVSRLSLTGPNGPVALAPLTLAPDSATILTGGIEGPLVAGTYTVNWQAVGSDGHPVRGEYTFVIAPGAQGLTTAAPSAAAPTQAAAPVATEEAANAESSGSNAWTWLIAVVILGGIGVLWFARRGRGDTRAQV
jgi:methionine-rich copper-binding protein CopC